MPYLVHGRIDPEHLSSEVRRSCDGAVALFVGTVRNENGGRAVERIEYSAYPEMAEEEMSAIAEELCEQFPDARIAMLHRLGTLGVGEVSVAVAAASPHRAEAFAACRQAIEAIKARVPIWKKEFGPDGAGWVEPSEEPSRSSG